MGQLYSIIFIYVAVQILHILKMFSWGDVPYDPIDNLYVDGNTSVFFWLSFRRWLHLGRVSFFVVSALFLTIALEIGT